MIQGFSVYRRNFGHWDVSSREHGRLFRLRGGPGQWDVINERPGKPTSATAYCWIIWEKAHNGPTQLDWIPSRLEQLEPEGDYLEVKL